MDRLACISLPSWALQIALRRFPPGYSQPVVLVREDRPTSPIYQLNKPARALGLRAGMRYSEALSLVCDLQAVVVSSDELNVARREVQSVLARWSPVWEACPFDQGCYWLGAAGLSGLYGTEAQWGASVRADLLLLRYQAVVVVGLTRVGTYVLARTRRKSTVILSAEAEKKAQEGAPLGVFPLPLGTRRLLDKLGVRTLAALLALPADEVARRFGAELMRDLRRLEAWSDLPLQSNPAPQTVQRHRRLESPLSDRQALMPWLVEPLRQGLAELRLRGRVLAELRLVFVLESGTLVSEVLRPAEPTTEERLLTRLLELRISRCDLPTAVVELRMAFHDVALPIATGELFAPPVVRDLRRGAEAVALLRAQGGNQSVVRPVLVDSHLPDQCFRWSEVETLVRPRVPQPFAPLPCAVRRVGWPSIRRPGVPAGSRLGPSHRLQLTSAAEPVNREYSFVRNSRHEIHWIEHDLVSEQTVWSGVVD